jgi:hypothetical protein
MKQFFNVFSPILRECYAGWVSVQYDNNKSGIVLPSIYGLRAPFPFPENKSSRPWWHPRISSRLPFFRDPSHPSRPTPSLNDHKHKNK